LVIHTHALITDKVYFDVPPLPKSIKTEWAGICLLNGGDYIEITSNRTGAAYAHQDIYFVFSRFHDYDGNSQSGAKRYH
jgi:hypothetical protein